MKTISDYTIYCTEEQTKKALELGAPIKIHPYVTRNKCVDYAYVCSGIIYDSPTTEQMIGFLEEHYYLSFDVYQPHLSWSCSVKYKDKECVFFDSLDPRKEATLAAIDAALEYINSSTYHLDRMLKCADDVIKHLDNKK